MLVDEFLLEAVCLAFFLANLAFVLERYCVWSVSRNMHPEKRGGRFVWEQKNEICVQSWCSVQPWQNLPIFSRANASSTSHHESFSSLTKDASVHKLLISLIISETMEDFAILLLASEYALRYFATSDFRCLFPVDEVYSLPRPQSTVNFPGVKSLGSLVLIPRLVIWTILCIWIFFCFREFVMRSQQIGGCPNRPCVQNFGINFPLLGRKLHAHVVFKIAMRSPQFLGNYGIQRSQITEGENRLFCQIYDNSETRFENRRPKNTFIGLCLRDRCVSIVQ